MLKDPYRNSPPRTETKYTMQNATKLRILTGGRLWWDRFTMSAHLSELKLLNAGTGKTPLELAYLTPRRLTIHNKKYDILYHFKQFIQIRVILR